MFSQVGNMLMFHVDINMKRLGTRFKNDSFKWFRVDSFFWETLTLYTVHFQISNFAGCFHSLRAVTHCMKGHFQKSIVGALIKLLFQCFFKWYCRKKLICHNTFMFYYLSFDFVPKYQNISLSLVHKRLWVAVILCVSVNKVCCICVNGHLCPQNGLFLASYHRQQWVLVN